MKKVFYLLPLLVLSSCAISLGIGGTKDNSSQQNDCVAIPLDKVAPVGEFVSYDMIEDEQIIYVMIEQDGKLVCSEMLGKDFKNAFEPAKDDN